MAHHGFRDRDELAARLAGDVAASLARRLELDGSTSLVVSGGSTPAAFLGELARRELDWQNVHVTLADDRCVPVSDPASNQRLLRNAFNNSAAATAHLTDIDMTASDAAQAWRRRLADMPRPFAAVVLGMGNDGHFASLFPEMPGLAAALDPHGVADIVPGVAPVEPRSRLSLTLAALLDTDLLALHVEGPAKFATLQRASVPGSPLEMPVRALLQQRRATVEIYYAP